MANKAVKPFLTGPEKLKFQRRLSHYLNDYEYKNNVPAKELAEMIDISPQKFSYVKSDKTPYGKFINSLDYLAKLGNLKNLSVSQFVEYLEGHDLEVEEGGRVKTSEWERTLINAFEPLTSKARTRFHEICKRSLRDGKRKLEALMDVVNILQDKDVEAIEAFRDGLKKVT